MLNLRSSNRLQGTNLEFNYLHARIATPSHLTSGVFENLKSLHEIEGWSTGPLDYAKPYGL